MKVLAILRVHGHTILQEQRAAEIYEEVWLWSVEGPFPGTTEDSLVQATLSAGQSGIGHKKARDNLLCTADSLEGAADWDKHPRTGCDNLLQEKAR